MERKGQRIIQLPGENGFHARDGSLTKKKREQWEKEKAEAEKHSWFPFGRKTLANKKSIIKEKNNDENAEMQNSRMEDQNTQKNNLEMNVANSSCNSSMAMEQQTIIPNESFNYSGHGQIPPIHSSPYPPLQQIHITANPSPILPIYMEYPPHPATPLYHPMPNFFPIQTAQQFAQFPPYPMPISAPTFLDPIFLHHQKVPFSMLPTPPFSGSSSSDSANSPPKDGQKEIVQQNQNQIGMDSTQMSNLRWQEELDKQMAEKRMAEEMEMEKRIIEQKRLEKEEYEKNKREEEERMAEERRRTQKIEIRDQNEQTYLDGIQRAQKEAELLKRAKLFRHILADGEAELEVAKEVLKSDDDKMVKEVLKQLRELEFQRRIAAENISFSAGQKQTKSPKTPQQGDAGKEKGSGERKQQQNSPKIGGPFQRAKSWNVKQQRTIPSPSMLPIPIRLKEKQNESGQKNNLTNGQPKVRFAANNSPQMASSKLLSVPPKEHKFVAPKPPTGNNNNKPKCNNSTSGRLSGLFEQLTLRRPRLSSFGSKEQRRMTLSGGQNVAENAVDLNGNFAADEKNATKLDRLNSNAPPKNGSNSTPSSQANSPTSSSIETASVVKFRHLLLSPTNSQEDDLSSEFSPLPPAPRIPIGSAKRKDGQFLVPQSPFSRKNSTNEGNKDCFGEQGIRRSLRSPTMRRLQDSLQSLATIEGNEGGEESRSSTPRPFNCRNPQYRSFNMRKDIARQKQILENLASVRAQLKSSQAQLEKTLSKQNLAGIEDQQQSSSNKNGESYI